MMPPMFKICTHKSEKQTCKFNLMANAKEVADDVKIDMCTTCITDLQNDRPHQKHQEQ